ncbi:carbon storage regulator, CsrA [Thermosinus carboxydivorans Nor1]|uniref:Translational regulator CsrA n=1 Tax=Thermosinus carboxydivorans Nor1 TaxID=401526 RepID=A1HT51_9FIRM|nr:carbon storage regulator CsrA [Thermosinus carboxydivorans]EAX46813.1 carbon storage regulator, CsrA [Thermosinus carboxydivorans Nor1]
MLALTRKCGERIVIGDNITVTVVDVKGDSVRLAIDAPRDVKVWRGELYDAIAAENKAAAVPVDLKVEFNR